MKWLELKKATYLACKTKAIIPAANGADDDVPLNSSVHLLCKSVVI